MLQACTEQKIILLADPRVIAIPISDNNDPMMDLKDQTELSYGPSPEIPNNTDYTKMRKSVYEKLVRAQSILPENYKLCLYEGFRSLNLQKKLFQDRYNKVQSLHPNWTPDEIFIETTKLVSPVVNQDGSHNVPPHSTGAAVDVYLIDNSGNTVDMGILVKDWIDDKDGSLSQTDSVIISGEARKNREIMNKALLSVGFINYPTEYWHWSYGDRYWAYHTGKTQALYGSVE